MRRSPVTLNVRQLPVTLNGRQPDLDCSSSVTYTLTCYCPTRSARGMSDNRLSHTQTCCRSRHDRENVRQASATHNLLLSLPLRQRRWQTTACHTQTCCRSRHDRENARPLCHTPTCCCRPLSPPITLEDKHNHYTPAGYFELR